MKLGILVETEEGLTWPAWRTTVGAVERLGFDSLWLSDHLESPWDARRHGLDPFIALAVAAAETRRIRLGTLVSPVTFRQPAILARMAESLDDLAAGRFVLGLGLGWNADEHARFEIPFPAARERVAALENGLKAIRAMHGERRIPILLGGAGEATRALAARYADAWNVTTAAPRRFSALSTHLGEVERSMAAGLLVGRNEHELRERARRMQRCVPPLGDVALEHVPEAARERGWLVGTVEQVTAQLRDLDSVGVDLAIVGHYDLEDVAGLELIAHEVMPGLR